MAGQRRRTLVFAVAGLALAWLVALGGYAVAKRMKVTPEQVAQYARSLDLSKLSAADREKALHRLADYLNGLSLEERRALRPDMDLFNEMTDAEKEWFLEATMPTQIKQSLTAFESLPPDQRQKVIDGALKSLRDQPADGGPGPQPALSPELEARLRTEGLKTFYGESSAQTKAELAPLLNELQLQMENGRQFRRGGNGPP
jgi:hypothetical protein